jgi:hypothetical protein
VYFAFQFSASTASLGGFGSHLIDQPVTLLWGAAHGFSQQANCHVAFCMNGADDDCCAGVTKSGRVKAGTCQVKSATVVFIQATARTQQRNNKFTTCFQQLLNWRAHRRGPP